MIFVTPSLIGNEIGVIEKIDEIRRRLNIALRSPMRWTGLLRRNMLARAIQGSNTIEGYNVTFEQAVAVVEGEEIETAMDTRQALLGYRNALTYILQLSEDRHFKFNEELIRSLHYMMISHDVTKHPGRWRPGPIFVRREPSGERVYEGPDAGLVPDLMREFVEGVQSANDSVPPIVRAAMAHLNLVMIHPFSDGNGRMGRAVQTYVLSRDGILYPTFSSIEEYLGSRGNTEAYYEILGEVGKGSWHPENDARPWVRFCLRAHYQQAVTVDRRMKEIARLWSDLEEELHKHKLPERMIMALYEAAIGFRVRTTRYSTMAEVSAQGASKDLHTLVKLGLLLPKGEKRGRIYIAAPVLREIRDKSREPRTPVGDVFEGQPNLPI
ncbi:MAG: Fic family protein [candidate division Zixibacteria bacterium]|nr:Fic family protein [candidate division Zixibacteria bacterium]